MMKHTFLLLAGLIAVDAATPSEAYAERRYNNLRTDPAVRHRRLLVAGRFEFAPLFESTINADFRHVIGGGAKLEYHLGDMLSIGVVGVYGTSLDTGLVNKIKPTLETTVDNMTREPSRDEFMTRLNSMPVHGGAYVSLTPWYGKLAAFSQAYVAFDFYFQAGLAFAQLKSSCPTSICNDTMDPEAAPDNNPNNDQPLNSGSRLGLYLAAGIHVFFNDFVALDLTIRDYAFSDNPSGADFNANLAVTSEDARFLHHVFLGAGISIMFPTTVKRTP